MNEIGWAMFGCLALMSPLALAGYLLSLRESCRECGNTISDRGGQRGKIVYCPSCGALRRFSRPYKPTPLDNLSMSIQSKISHAETQVQAQMARDRRSALQLQARRDLEQNAREMRRHVELQREVEDPGLDHFLPVLKPQFWRQQRRRQRQSPIHDDGGWSNTTIDVKTETYT